MQSQRDEVGHRLNDVRSNLEIDLDSDLYLVQGLAAAISIEPDMSQERFSALAAQVFKESKNLRSVAAAPKLIIELVYPMEGNEDILGLNYRSLPEQLPDVVQSRQTGKMVLSGPVEVIQGGRAVVGLYPISDHTQSDAPFWGLVSAVIDLDRLIDSNALYNPNSDINFTLEKQSNIKDAMEILFGEAETVTASPVRRTVRLPFGQWRISAIPVNGWNQDLPYRWLLRGAFLIAAALIVIPMLASTFLIYQRHEYIDVLSRQKEDLHRQSRRLHLAMTATRAGVWEYDIDTKTVFWDVRMNELYGYPPSFREHHYKDWSDRLHPDDKKRALKEFETGLKERSHISSIFRILLPDGTIRHVRALGNAYNFKDSNKIIGVNWDITEETELQESIEAANLDLKEKNAQIETARQSVDFLAHHDTLTQLPNRRFLNRLLEQHEMGASEGHSFAAVLQIDLDGFKNINDTLGHLAGDQILVQVGGILQNIIPPQDCVIRLGGDEFVVLITRPDKIFFTEGNNLQHLAKAIIQALQAPFLLPSGTTKVSASIGISTDAISTTTSDNLLRDADVALYEAKLSGRNQFKLCDTDLRRTLDHKNQFLSEIETALAEGQIIPYYQPQYSGGEYTIFGVEALARWDHPTRGLLTPKDFLAGAKEIGKDAEIDRAVLLRVLEDREKWAKAGIAVPRISVNVSAKQISTPNILAELAELNIPKGVLCFELLESIFMDDDNQILRDNVAGIKDMGIEIEIDDFGTGFASIVALQKLSPMRLKIDNQLISPITESQSSRQIVAALIDIGKSLSIEVIAEGVESENHAQTLSEMGCDALQGYALCVPLSFEDFRNLLTLSKAGQKPFRLS